MQANINPYNRNLRSKQNCTASCIIGQMKISKGSVIMRRREWIMQRIHYSGKIVLTTVSTAL